MVDFEWLAGHKTLFWLMYLHLTAQKGRVRPEDVDIALSNMIDDENSINLIAFLDQSMSDGDKNLVWTVGQTYVNTTKDVVAQAESFLTDLE